MNVRQFCTELLEATEAVDELLTIDATATAAVPLARALLDLHATLLDCLDEGAWYERGQLDARARKRIVGMGGTLLPQEQVKRNVWTDYGDVALGAYRRGYTDYLRQFAVWH
jgi:hypothetical protein